MFVQVGWQLPRVVAALKQHRFSASVTLIHAASATESIGFLRRKSSTGAVSLSSHHSSVSSLSSVESLRDSGESIDGVGVDAKPRENGETEDQNQKKKVPVHETAIGRLEEPRMQDSGNSSANEQTEETEKERELKTAKPAIPDDKLEAEQQVQSEGGHTVTEVISESSYQNSAKTEKLSMTEEHPKSVELQPMEAVSSAEGQLHEAVAGSHKDQTEDSFAQSEDDKPIGDTREEDSKSEDCVTQSEDNKPSGGMREEGSKSEDSVSQSEDNKPTGDTREEDSKSPDHSEDNGVLSNVKPCSEDNSAKGHELSPPLLRKRSSSSLPPTPMIARVADLIPVREVSSARSSPTTSPHPRRKPTPWFPPPPREPHPDDFFVAAQRKISKLAQLEQPATGQSEGQQVDQKQEVVATADAEGTGSSMPVVGKSSEVGEDEHDGNAGSKTDGSHVAHPVPIEVQTVVYKEEPTKMENGGDEKNMVDDDMKKKDGKNGDTLGEMLAGKKSENSSRGSSPTAQVYRIVLLCVSRADSEW